jgi:hypothetical protein
MFGFVQGTLYLVIAIGAFAFEGWALIDALRHSSGAYPAAGKQSKGLWGGILAGATAIGFLALPYPFGAPRVSALGILGIAALAAAGIYAASVRPALRSVGKTSRPRREQRGGW